MTTGPEHGEMAPKRPDSIAGSHALKDRVQEELRQYLALTAYLYVCFGVVLLFEVTQNEASTASIWHLGTVAGKALIVGKFVLLGEAAGVGTRIGSRTVLQRIAWRLALLVVALVMLTAIEEVIVGLLNGRSAAHTLGELFGTALPATAAKTLLMLLILAPMVMLTEIGRALDPRGLRRLLHRTPGGTSSATREPADVVTPSPPGASAPDRQLARRAHPRSPG